MPPKKQQDKKQPEEKQYIKIIKRDLRHIWKNKYKTDSYINTQATTIYDELKRFDVEDGIYSTDFKNDNYLKWLKKAENLGVLKSIDKDLSNLLHVIQNLKPKEAFKNKGYKSKLPFDEIWDYNNNNNVHYAVQLKQASEIVKAHKNNLAGWTFEELTEKYKSDPNIFNTFPNDNEQKYYTGQKNSYTLGREHTKITMKNTNSFYHEYFSFVYTHLNHKMNNNHETDGHVENQKKRQIEAINKYIKNAITEFTEDKQKGVENNAEVITFHIQKEYNPGKWGYVGYNRKESLWEEYSNWKQDQLYGSDLKGMLTILKLNPSSFFAKYVKEDKTNHTVKYTKLVHVDNKKAKDINHFVRIVQLQSIADACITDHNLEDYPFPVICLSFHSDAKQTRNCADLKYWKQNIDNDNNNSILHLKSTFTKEFPIDKHEYWRNIKFLAGLAFAKQEDRDSNLQEYIFFRNQNTYNVFFEYLQTELKTNCGLTRELYYTMTSEYPQLYQSNIFDRSTIGEEFDLFEDRVDAMLQLNPANI